MKATPPALLFLAFLLTHQVCAAGPEPVRMFPASGELQPGTTLEFRFPAAMVGPADLGPAAASPVVFEPAMAGSFTWLSTRSGVFSPDGPLPLGGSWKARLRDGLADADGQPVTAKLDAALTTPPFGVTAVSSGVWDNKAVAPDVEVKLAFALPVAPDASFFRFVDAAGQTVAANVRTATRHDFFSVPADAEDWELRWRQVSDPRAGRDEEQDAIASRLVVRPASPLPAADGWRLTVAAGLPATSGGQKLAAPYEVPLGTVSPFTLQSLEAGNYINSGTSLSFEFSNGLAPDITSDNAGKFFGIEPAPEGLSWEVSYGTVTARGKFALDRDYRLVIGSDVVSSAGAPFSGSRERTFRFAPVPPRLYLPELTMAQIVGGRRVLPVRSVNLASLRVKATLLPDNQAARAWSVFQENQWNYEEGTPVPTAELEGRKLTDEEIKLEGASIDARQTTDLDWTRILGGRKAGVILLELEGRPLEGTGTQRPAAQALIVLSDLGVLWKKAGDDVLVHVFSTATGAPATGAKARLLDAGFETLVRATGDERGNAKLKFPDTPAWLVVTKDDDTCVLPMGPSAETLRIGDWFSGGWSVPQPAEAGARAMIFTDRPLYQPGETARIKGYLRAQGPEGFTVAAGREVRLILRNPEYNEVARITATTDARGAFEASLDIPLSPLGNYFVHAGVGSDDAAASAPFLVTPYQPDAFEVKLDLPSEFAAGAPGPRATVDGSYFFGGRLTGAEVRWTLAYTARDFSPAGYDGFVFLRDTGEERKTLTLRGEAVIDGRGPAVIEPALPVPALAPAGGTLTAEVTDINQQTVSTDVSFVRQASDFYLGIARPDDVVQAGRELPLSFIAVRPDGTPLGDPVNVEVAVRRIRHNVVRVLGAGGAMTFRRDVIEEPLPAGPARTVVPSKSQQVWSAGDRESMRFTPPDPGEYRILVTARDAGGREVASEVSLYAEGEGAVVWDYRNPYEVTLVPDKETYLPGETARVMVKSPIDAEAFVSIEQGDRIRREMRLPLSGNAPVLEIPLDEGDAPGVTVALVMVRGADASKRKFPVPEFRFGSCTLAVDRPGTRLKVAVEPDTDSVLPGSEVATTIAVTDSHGRPVPDAGVTFYAVDDGILALTGFNRPDPSQVFLTPVSSRVLTGLSLADLLPEDPEDIEFGNKGYLIGGGGEAGPVSLRENFPGTATWQPSLVTGPDGRVTARFTAPDALTRYRLVAVADSGALSFGSGESSVKIARPLMILPSLGQFANAGDDLVARAVIRNETGQDGTVEVSFTSPAGTQNASLQVAQGAAAAADFPLKFAQPGTVPLEWSAAMKAGGTEFADRVKIELPVGSPMLQLRETYFSELDAKTNDLMDGVNPQVAEGTGNVAVTVANTRLAGVARQARFLAEYPYGCAEQTVSAFVPWVVMPELGSVLPEFARPPEEMERVRNETVAEIFALQTSEGGLAFWPGGGRPSPFASAWAAIVLSRLAPQGVTLPQNDWNPLLAYLAKSLRGIGPDLPPAELAEKTYAALGLALAGRPEAAYHEQLFQRRAELPSEARAILALAILKSGGDREMAARLLRPDAKAPEDASPFGGAARDRAIRLLAWSNFEPRNPEVAKLLAEVLAFGPLNRSGTTQSSAWTLLALADYRALVEKPGRGKGAAKGTIVAGGESTPFAVDAKTPALTRSFPLDGAPGAALKVENPSAARLFGETSFAVYPPLGEQPRQDRGFAVSRSYRKLAADGSLQPAEDLRVGDRIVVTVRVAAERPTFFVAVDDPLPSILEAVNPDFVSRGVGGAPAGEADNFVVSHREMRADRVVFFCDALPAGPHIFEYLARVRVAGEATAAATKAEAMYRPERFGLGETSRLTSRAATGP